MLVQMWRWEGHGLQMGDRATGMNCRHWWWWYS